MNKTIKKVICLSLLTIPLAEQPDVPEVIPKGCDENVPLVVRAKSCINLEFFWMIRLPRPQPASPAAWALGADANANKKATKHI